MQNYNQPSESQLRKHCFFYVSWYGWNSNCGRTTGATSTLKKDDQSLPLPCNNANSSFALFLLNYDPISNSCSGCTKNILLTAEEERISVAQAHMERD
ncbi:hypothetical protein U1Q18_030366 [Sarracenia purpurea var. burkii]